MRWTQRVLGAAVCALLVAGGSAATAQRGRRDAVVASSDGEPRLPRPRPVAARNDPAPPTTTALAVGSPAVPTAAPALRTFERCGPLLEHVRGVALAEVTAYGLSAQPMSEVAVSGGSTSGSAQGTGASAGGDSAAYSSTNIQEADVDEPDVVKNDATRALTLFGGVLRSVAIDDTGVDVDGEVDLGLPDDAELLQVGDRLVALSSPDPSVTRIVVIDTSDLRVVHRIDVEGSYVSARRIGDTVRLVVTQNGPAFDFTYPRSDDEAEVARALDHNRGAIVRASLAEWLPDVTVDGSRRFVPAPACGDVYTPASFAGSGSTTVVTVSPVDGAILDATAVLATASEVYATKDHLYVATSAWKPSIEPVTEIHRFDVSDPHRSVYEASGSVPGRLLRAPWFAGQSHLGQWALSEHAGDLRVATTIEAVDAPVANAVTVLRREADRLLPIGHLGGLGVGEQLYAIRFIGTRGFLVTYVKVDPLFVLDLTDPTMPRLVGELKVRGYSAYLHPIGDGALLGIGQDDENEDGLADGAQVSRFDVRDPARPTRTAQLRLGDRGSITGAESDHRTFTWWPDPARAVLTMTDFEDPTAFHGAVVLGVGDDAITEIGRIEHRDRDAPCATPIARSRVIGENLLTFSSMGIGVDALADLSHRDFARYDKATRPCNGEPPTTTTSSTSTTTIPLFGGQD